MRSTGNRESGIGDRERDGTSPPSGGPDNLLSGRRGHKRQKVASSQWLVTSDETVRHGVPDLPLLPPLRPTAYSLQPTASRTAFTLTELLVVITIIAVLAALTTAAVMRAMGTARQTRIKVEIDQLDAALRAYKEKYGSYPPSNFSAWSVQPDLRAHIARAFPRYDLTYLHNDLTEAGLDMSNKRYDQSLVFWLRGFGPDVTHPFVSWDNHPIINGVKDTTTTVKPTPFFDFDQSRLVSLNPSSPVQQFPSYIPAGVKTNAPYIYFDPVVVADASSVKNVDTSGIYNPDTSVNLRTTVGIVRPFWVDGDADNAITAPPTTNDQYANSDSFQIIAAGMDGRFSSLDPNGPLGAPDDYQPFYPNGTIFNSNTVLPTIDTAYDDNVSNFCDRARMGDARP